MHPAAPVPAAYLKRENLQWFAQDDNYDYFADELLTISNAEQLAWCDAARRCYDAMRQTARNAVSRHLWRELGIPANAQRLISYSVQNEWDDYLIGRFDFAGGFEHFPLKLLEFNADTCSLMPETALIQRQVWLQSAKRMGNGPFDPLFPALTRRLQHILQRHPQRHASLLVTTLGNEEDELNANIIAKAARMAGFEVVDEVPLEDVIFDPENGLFVEHRRDQFTQYDFCFKIVPWDFIAYEEPGLMDDLTTIITEGKAVVLNPAWSMLLQSKGILPLLAKDHPTEAALLRAGFSSTDFPDGRYARKPLFGRTGDNVALYDGQARPIAETPGDFGHQPYIFQELAGFAVDLEGYRYQPSVYFTDQPVSIAIRRQDDLIIDDDAEYVAHTVV